MLRQTVAVVLAACACGPQGSSDERQSDAADHADDQLGTASLDTIAVRLEVPWALSFAPDGRLFLTERPGRIRVLENGTLAAEPWATLDVAAIGEAGLMGIAVAPDFAATGHLYVVGTFRDGSNLVNRVVRFTESGGRGADPTVVVDAIPAANFHAGDAIAFGRDGMMYVATGDARDPPSAQDPASRAGKILRYRPDGSIPDDNPDPRSPVYAAGVRNVQGLAWHAETGDLFAIDHGPSGFPDERFRRNNDELNVIRAGGNYGWPEVAGSERDERFLPPVAVWTPAIAPGGLAIYSGPSEAWRGDAFVGGLRGEQLRRLTLERATGTPSQWRVTGEEALFKGRFGRIRAVAMGPDGDLYFTTSNRDGRGRAAPSDDRIFRLRPARRQGAGAR